MTAVTFTKDIKKVDAVIEFGEFDNVLNVPE